MDKLECVYSNCSIEGPTELPPSLREPLDDGDLDCGSGEWYSREEKGETCDSVALMRSVSSATLFIANQNRLPNDSSNVVLEEGTKLCLPLQQCPRTYSLQPDDAWKALEINATMEVGRSEVMQYNPWICFECYNLQALSSVYGTVICLPPLDKEENVLLPLRNPKAPAPANIYAYDRVDPPKGAKAASGTTERCGHWHAAEEDESCARICMASSITINLLLEVNTSLGTDFAECSGNIVVGNAYYMGPNVDWADPDVTASIEADADLRIRYDVC
ncbi:hypothetical protein ACJZ2D_004128 [Fusarium nematophilum]